MAVNPIASMPGVTSIREPGLAGSRPADSQKFQDALSEAVQKVEQFRLDARQGVERLLSGEGADLHRVALQTQQAELAFEMFLQVRNKVVQAYQEVMRMQI